MMFTRAIVAVGVVVSCVLLHPQPAAAQAREHAIYASVLDDKGNPVEGLNAAGFVVREDDVTREVLRVVPADEPMQIALIVDNSAAAESMITQLRQALARFITTMTEPLPGGGRNELAIITIASRPTIAANYTSDRKTLLDAANRIFADTSSAAYLLDALVETSQGLQRRGAMRPVMISITTEGRDFSSRRREQALDALDRAGGIFDAIIVGPSATDLTDEGRDRSIVLGQGTIENGGHRDILLTSMSLPDRLGKLADELSHQYKVVYSRPETLIPPDEITISAADPNQTAYGVPVKEADARGGR
jgi:hypothetical protein